MPNGRQLPKTLAWPNLKLKLNLKLNVNLYLYLYLYLFGRLKDEWLGATNVTFQLAHSNSLCTLHPPQKIHGSMKISSLGSDLQFVDSQTRL